MNKKKVTIVILICVVLSGAMILTLANNKKEIDSKKEIKVGNATIAVSVVPAKTLELGNQLSLVGSADPIKEVVVSAETSGKIIKMNFKAGDFVTQGAVLAKVEDTYKRLAYESAQLNCNKFKEDYERFQNLRKGDAVTETQLRDMRLGYENAQIQLENAKKQLEDTKITMPFSGFITSKNTEVGAFVNFGTPIASIADISQLKVSLGVSESDAYQLKVGQSVNITTDIYPDVKYAAKISSIGAKSNTAHIYPVEIMISNNGKNKLKAGTYVSVQVDMAQSKKALVIPRESIISTIKDPTVYVVEGDIARLVKINVGRIHNSYLEVISGLSEGDQVITNGQINLTDGSKITVVKK